MENRGLIKVIEHCRNNNIIASIYDEDSEPEDGHWCGYIQEYNKEEILIRHISAAGESDGFVWKRLESIYRIDYDGSYEKKIETLYNLKGQKHLLFSKMKEVLLFSLLDFSIKEKLIVSVDMGYNDFCGIVKDYDNITMTIQEIDSYGKAEGIICVSLDKVRTVRCDGKEERNSKYLMEV